MLPGAAPPEIKALLEAISSGEGGWNSVNSGLTIQGLTDMTISQARETGMRIRREGKGSGALGKWQQMPIINGVNTLRERTELAGLNYEKDKFSPENQTKISRAYLSSVYGGEAKLIKDLQKDPMIAVRKLSGVWPSLPGGSQQNTTEKQFKENYAKAIEKYGTTGGPSLSAKGVKKFTRTDITSFFRQQESFRSKPHEGMDIAAPQGTPISFGMGGEIIGVWRTNSGARDANGGYGTYMDVKFSDGRIARIAHLSSVPSSLRKGSKFGANQIIAYSGGEKGKPGSGRSGGPHIHLEQLSKPMGIEETTRGKYDPLKGGLFNLIQQGGTRASLAPSQSSAVASLNKSGILKEDTSAFIYNNNTVAFVPIEVPAGVA